MRPPLARLVLALLVATPGTLHAQWVAVRDLPSSAAQAALGDAHPLVGSAGNVIFVHPGLLDSGSGFGAFLGWSADGGTHLSASAAGPWLDGGVGVGVSVLSYAVGSFAPHDALVSGGSADITESLVTVGYAREAIGGVRVGGALTLVETRSTAERRRVLGVDVGAARRVGPVALALSVLGLGEEASQNGDDPRVSLGLGTERRPTGPVDLAAAAHLSRETDGTVSPGGGLEVSWWPIAGRRFIGRIGLRRVAERSESRPWTVGAAFEGDDIALEYALQEYSGSGSVHRFGVRWR